MAASFSKFDENHSGKCHTKRKWIEKVASVSDRFPPRNTDEIVLAVSIMLSILFYLFIGERARAVGEGAEQDDPYPGLDPKTLDHDLSRMLMRSRLSRLVPQGCGF